MKNGGGAAAAPADPAEPLPEQGTELMRWVQSTLNRVMGLNLAVDGLTGPETRSAIRTFQERQGLVVDGLVGPDTKTALIAARRALSGAALKNGSAPPSPNQDGELLGEVQPRNSHAYIKWVQHALNKIMGLQLAVDGISGPQTRSAVRDFQRRSGLTVDGIVGPNTESALVKAGAGQPPKGAVPGSGSTVDKWVLPAHVRTSGEAQFVRYDSPPAWSGGRNCVRSLTPGAAELRAHILASFSGVRAIGGFNCRQNSANRSETSVHGTGRALDIMISPINNRANKAVGDPIASWLVQNAASIGVQFIIWNRVKWNGSYQGRKDRDYGGPNPHIDHIHVELNRDGAARQTSWY